MLTIAESITPAQLDLGMFYHAFTRDPSERVIVSSSSTSIVSPFVVGIDNPEAGWVDVRVKKRVRHSGEHSQIILKNIVFLNTILNEE